MIKKLLLITCLCLFPVWATADSYTPATANLTVNAGEDFGKTWRLRSCTAYSADGSRCITQNPTNLSGYQFRAQVKTNYAAAGSVLTTFNITLTTGGVINISLPNTTTQSLSGRSAYWDLLMITPSGVQTYIMKGTILFKPTITQ